MSPRRSPAREDELVALLVALDRLRHPRARPGLRAARGRRCCQEHLARPARRCRLRRARLGARRGRAAGRRGTRGRRATTSAAGRSCSPARRAAAAAARSCSTATSTSSAPTPSSEWTSDPFTGVVRDGRVYGRGACDMKGGVAAMVVAAETLRALDVPLRGDLLVNTVTDEESTGLGSLASALDGAAADGGDHPRADQPDRLARHARDADARDHRRGSRRARRLPARPDGSRRARQRDRQHADRARRAARAERRVAAAARHPAFAPRRPGRSCRSRSTPGSGSSPTPRAARCAATCSTCPGRPTPTAGGTLVEREVEARVAAAAARRSRGSPRTRRGSPGRATRRPRFHGPDEPISATTLDAIGALGLRARGRRRAPRSSTGRRSAAPARRRSRAGPGDIGVAHAVDEHVPIGELVRAAQVLAVAAMRFCGVAG